MTDRKNLNEVEKRSPIGTDSIDPSPFPSPSSTKLRPSGILRLDSGKRSRRSSGMGSAVEFRNDPELLGESTPTSSNPISPQLSVTWAFLQQNEDTGRGQDHQVVDDNLEPIEDNEEAVSNQARQRDDLNDNYSKNYSNFMDLASPLEVPVEDSEDEDYSVSVSAIMQRRASMHRGRSKRGRSPRRTSSPLTLPNQNMVHQSSNATDEKRRRSSVYTTSSADTAISFDEDKYETAQEQIFENIRLHKEVLQSVKFQTWSMRRKLRLIRQAKAYIAKHEGALQERRNTRDLMARLKLLISAKLQHTRRELANISTILIPWESRIKEIESHFGSVVASYFTFLRWLFWVNIVIAIVIVLFVVLPEMLATDLSPRKDDQKQMLPEEAAIAGNFITLWDFEGFLKYSPLFYGYYSNLSESLWGYKLPLAYFLTGLVVYVYSFVATLRKMAENSRMSKLSSKDDECVFSWKLFTGWDFMIGHAETSHNRVASVVLGFKEALLEEAEKKKDKRNWKVIVLRILMNILVIALLCVSAYAVILVVNRSIETASQSSWWRRNEITICLSSITYFFPMIFEALGYFESYHPRQQLRLQLARIMLLNLLNLYSLIFALFAKISIMNRESERIRLGLSTEDPPYFTTTPMTFTTTPMTFDAFTKYLQGRLEVTTTSPLPSTTTFQSVLGPEPLRLWSTVQTIFTTTEEPFFTEAEICYDIEVPCFNSTNQTLIANNGTAKMSILLALIALANNTGLNLVPQSYNLTNMSLTYDNFTYLNNSEYNESMVLQDDDPYHINNNNFFYFDVEHLLEEIEEEDPNDRLRRFIEGFQNITMNLSNVTLDQGISDLFNSTFENSSLNTFIEEVLSNTTSFNWNQLFLIEDDNEPYFNYTEEKCYERVCENETSSSTTEFEDFTTETTFETSTFTENIETTFTTTVEFFNQTDSTTIYIEPTTTTEMGIIQNTTIPITTTTVGPAKENSTLSPKKIIPITDISELRRRSKYLDNETQTRLRKLCWETMFGQELVKLTVMDLFVTIISTLCLDFFRALFVRFMNRCWCWDLEKKFPKYGDFKIAENILHLVNNQGMVWMGMFFSPGLAILNLVKLIIILYLRSWAVLTCNVPHEVVFRASRSNNFYLALLLTMLFLCVLPVAYAIVWISPSWHCGPFSYNMRISHILTKAIKEILPQPFHAPLDRMASASTVIPLLVLLILIIYYLVSLTNALREANQDLRNQLRRERSEERRKMLRLTQQKRISEEEPTNKISMRWRKVLESASSPLTPNNTNAPTDEELQKMREKKERLQKIMKKALRKGSATSDEESAPINDDETDTEIHESVHLPHDHQEEEDNKINKRKLSTNLNNEKKRDIFPELIKKLRESKKRIQKENEALKDVKEQPNVEAGQSQTSSITRRKSTQIAKQDPVTEEFCVVDEKRKPIITEMIPKTKPEVFTFDQEHIEGELALAENEKKEIKLVTCKEFDSPRCESPVFYEKVQITENTDPKEDSKKIKASDKRNSFFNLVKAMQKKKTGSETESCDVSDNLLNKRDSQSSIVNIPTILISKTESDECILEKQSLNDKIDKDSS